MLDGELGDIFDIDMSEFGFDIHLEDEIFCIRDGQKLTYAEVFK